MLKNENINRVQARRFRVECITLDPTLQSFAKDMVIYSLFNDTEK